MPYSETNRMHMERIAVLVALFSSFSTHHVFHPSLEYVHTWYLSIPRLRKRHTHIPTVCSLLSSFVLSPLLSLIWCTLFYIPMDEKTWLPAHPQAATQTDRQTGPGTVIDKDAFSCGKFTHRHSRPETLSPIWPRRRTAAGVNHSHQIGAGFRFVSW